MEPSAAHDHYTDRHLLDVLRQTRTVAMVGASERWQRPSYFVMKYLQAKGYRVVPVNPKAAAAGEHILGERACASLAEVPAPIDLVDIFRASDAAAAIVEQVLALREEKQIRFVWMQLGVRHDQAARRAEAAGLVVIMDRCPKIEYSRLHAELSWSGANSEQITSKRRRVALL